MQGLITLEDIIEEIVGDIRDEHDVAVLGVRKQRDGSVVVDGSATIRELNRAMGWNLPDDEAATVAGLVIHEARSIPEPRQTFSFHGFRFEVLRKQRNRIAALRITPLAARPAQVPRADQDGEAAAPRLSERPPAGAEAARVALPVRHTYLYKRPTHRPAADERFGCPGTIKAGDRGARRDAGHGARAHPARRRLATSRRSFAASRRPLAS